MKKSNFINGAFITTFGIVISKILGVIYVIFFHNIVGDSGGALYGYGYTIYTFFLSIASLGIPLSISKIVSEYQALGFYSIKKRVFLLAKKISLLLGFISFLLVIFLAPVLAHLVIGKGDINHIRDVIFVIRISGIALLVVPVLSIYRAYFEGHRLFVEPSISGVLEQIFRVSVIILGSYICLKVLKLKLSIAIGVSIFATCVGGIVAYIYLVSKYILNRKFFNEKIRSVNEPVISNKNIIRKIIIYSIPFIMIDLFKSMYNVVDMFTVVRNLKNIGYSLVDSEAIYSMLSTWANKFNMIALAISSGVIASIIPSLSEALVKKKSKSIESIIQQGLNIFLFLGIPITLGISILANPIWVLFYGKSIYGPSLLSFNIFVGLFIGIFTIFMIILQILGDYKMIFVSLFSGFMIKLVFNSYLLVSFHRMGLSPYYGVITASVLGYLLSIIISIIYIHRRYDISFQKVFKNLIDILVLSFIMIFVLFVIRFIIPISSSNRLLCIIIILIYTIIGGGVYFLGSNKMGLFKKIFGNDLFKFFKK